MKNCLKLTSAFLLAAASISQCIAAPVTVKGQVEYIRTHDAGRYPAWAAPTFWFTLKGVTHAGDCSAWTSGTILFVGADKQELALVLAAQGSGQEVAVAVDDSVLTNSYCSVSYITTGNPAPLN